MKGSIISTVLVFFVLLIGCNKDDDMQTSLVITIVDEQNLPLQNVHVELYMSLDEWLNESGMLFDVRNTDENGQVRFMQIDTGTYYINAYLEERNNWESGVVKQVVEGFENTTNILLFETKSGILSNSAGKKWILTGFTTNGEDSYGFLEDCILDDTLQFYKGPSTGAYLVSRGALKCNPLQEDSIPGLWTILENPTSLRIQFGNDILNWNIDTLKVDKLSVTYVETGNVQKAEYVPVE